MDLTTAIDMVLAHSREEDPDQELTDREILAEIRGFDHAEIDSWIESEVLEPGERETAYRAVLDASDDEITASRTTRTATRTETDEDTDCL
ncbi:hypothetical protein ACFWMR_00260 [Amycolatopsis thailandensis]|uniref:Uncharacterized protein n=1 Tax=Amycolatopsis thailandensis TaxID=589330 RepID=A0A229REQ1_9PSEU|nr:hypothetical protein [Amycolatopsis thailandensis]OXM44941.1 hypothetical protein CFP71_39515 [Amycolatopsis thailandensis]